MSSITDEVRKLADDYDVLPCYGLADRIDSEMVELPRDKDGAPIHVGDTVFGDDGRAWLVRGVTVGMWARGVKNHVVHAEGDGGEWRDLNPEWLTHERPDSFERIADEIDGAKAWCDVNGNRPAPVSSISNETLHKWAERIRKLAREAER